MEENDEWKNCCFKKGDMVCYKGAIGTVTGVAWNCSYEHWIDYFVVIEGDDERDRLVVNEDGLAEADFSYIETGDEISLAKPLFQAGDVVSVDGHNELGVVSEAVIVNTGETAKYMYEVSPFYSDGEACAYEESFLEYQYHDTAWEECLMALETDKLPPWRGELYNSREFDWGPHYRWERSYFNDTIPPDCMEYILDEYSVYKRIHAVFASKKNRKDVMEIFGIADSEALDEIIRAICNKIFNRNLSEVDSDFKKKADNKTKFEFTELELAIVSEVDRRDIWLGQSRNHYPVKMTEMQIMRAIKEAYESAHEVGKRKLQKYVSRGYRGWRDEKEPEKGSVLYEGISKNGLIIRFWYNFDLDLIETAYPIMVDNNAKKH